MVYLNQNMSRTYPNYHSSLLIISDQTSDAFEFIPFEAPNKHPDVLILNAQKEPITIDQVRELKHELLLKPYKETYKVILILNAELLVLEAQHALLKSLEEPSHFVQFILLTKHPSLLLATLLSRCVTQYPKTSNGQKTTTRFQSLSELSKLSIEKKFEIAKIHGKKELAYEYLLFLLQDATELLEIKPTLKLIATVKSLQKAFQFIKANTNPQLSLEWAFLQLE